jgi:hypothetical protein
MIQEFSSLILMKELQVANAIKGFISHFYFNENFDKRFYINLFIMNTAAIFLHYEKNKNKIKYKFNPLVIELSSVNTKVCQWSQSDLINLPSPYDLSFFSSPHKNSVCMSCCVSSIQTKYPGY